MPILSRPLLSSLLCFVSRVGLVCVADICITTPPPPLKQHTNNENRNENDYYDDGVQEMEWKPQPLVSFSSSSAAALLEAFKLARRDALDLRF